ncbi:hypothetical protein QQY66_23285 [Streptomyces sp. DG2A-72]|uniref:hypothetical protein n=1 Tax=Streptomyces sp. DG2A-72 TaxID=3051386 RepID=UPI00265C2067|nr:hypothetical protein [Streptomyces sp. DG2A-72]MDO0934456.1 hypothetical protein [Streptomyces sp. DG2A-72]
MPPTPPGTGTPTPTPAPLTAPVVLEAGALVELATAVWRLRNKVEVADGTSAGVRRHLDAVVDALVESGVQTRSYDGTVFDPGLRMRVLAYQPMPGLERDEVVETVRPAVYLRGTPLALGEVIVGTPPEEPKEEGGAGQ